MIRVKNKKIIAKLSKKSLKANRFRNNIAILAIALTATLFSSLFTIGGGTLKTSEQSMCRQVGTLSHAGYKFLTWKDYEALQKVSGIKEFSYDICAAVAENPELSKESVEIRYSEDLNAKWGFSYPTTGRMPENYKEIATSTIVLDALGLPHELGTAVTLEFTIAGKKYQESFTLCGFWDSDSLAPAQQAWLSKEYINEVAPTPDIPIYEREVYDMAGYLSVNFNFYNTWNLEKKLNAVNHAMGFPEGDGGFNWAYSTSDVDFSTLLLIAMVLLLIFTSGYLIIYNIFYISVAKDTQFYGLLKTIGTTGRQLKKVVRRQAFSLAIPGIIIGLFCGWLLGSAVLPLIMNVTYFAGETEISTNPLIFVGAAIFSFVTVYISCDKPARVAAKVSPMEALHANEVEKASKDAGRNRRQSRKVTPVGMARQNIRKNRKKVIIVVLSLSMSIVLLNTVYTVVHGFDIEKYLGNDLVADFSINNTALLNKFELTYMEDEYAEQIKEIEGIEKFGVTYMEEMNGFHLSDQARERMFQLMEEYGQELNNKYIAEYIKMAKEEGKIPAHLYGMNQVAFEKLRGDNTLDWEQFESGNYILVTPFLGTSIEDKKAYYKPGDTVTLENGDGSTKDYEVLAVVEIPYAMTCMHGHWIEEGFILPEKEYLARSKVQTPLNILLDVSKEKEAQIEETLSSMCEQSDLDYTSKAQAVADFEKDIQMYRTVGGSLAAVLAMIGILNFFNSSATSVLSRKRELAMLQSIGMTTKQLITMLISEGMWYALFTIVFVLTIGNLFTYGLVMLLAGGLGYFTYHFTLVPVLLCIPLLLGITALVPYFSYHGVAKESIIERLRKNE